MHQIEELFIPPHISVNVSLLDTDIECIAYYDANNDFDIKPIDSDFNNFREVELPNIEAFLYEQFFNWCLRKYKIQISIDVTDDNLFSYVFYSMYNERRYSAKILYDGTQFDNLHFHKNDALNEAVIKMIKLIDNNMNVSAIHDIIK